MWDDDSTPQQPLPPGDPRRRLRRGHQRLRRRPVHPTLHSGQGWQGRVHRVLRGLRRAQSETRHPDHPWIRRRAARVLTCGTDSRRWPVPVRDRRYLRYRRRRQTHRTLGHHRGTARYDGTWTQSGRRSTEVSDLDETEANKQLITRFADEVLLAGAFDRLSEFMVPDCAEHNPDVGDGIAALHDFATQTGMRYVELHKVVGSGNFVATLAEAEVAGERRAVIDLFRVAGGMIVEHWDVAEEITPEDTWVNSGKS